MKMKRIIKITESQLRETEGEAFKYLDTTDDTTPYNGQSTITAQGKLNGEENGEPIITDRIGKQRTPQSWARYRAYGNINMYPHKDKSNFINDNLDEGISVGDDKDNDGVPDHYENVGDMGGLDILSDGDDSNNLTVIPKSVDVKLELLNKAMENLSPKQKAIVINNFLEQNDISQIPNAWKKTLMYKVSSNNDNPNMSKIK